MRSVSSPSVWQVPATSPWRGRIGLRLDVLRHRLHLNFEALAERVRPEVLVDAVFAAVPSP